jgi:hypothetical protein
MEGADDVVEGLPSTCLIVDTALFEAADDRIEGWDHLLAYLYATSNVLHKENVVAFNTYVFDKQNC